MVEFMFNETLTPFEGLPRLARILSYLSNRPAPPECRRYSILRYSYGYGDLNGRHYEHNIENMKCFGLSKCMSNRTSSNHSHLLVTQKASADVNGDIVP